MNPLIGLPGLMAPGADMNYLLTKSLIESNPMLLQQMTPFPFLLNSLSPLASLFQPQISLNLLLPNPQLMTALQNYQQAQPKTQEKIDTKLITSEPANKKTREEETNTLPTSEPLVKSPPKQTRIIEEEKTIPAKEITSVIEVEESSKDAFWTEENKKKLIEWAVKCKCDWKKVAKKFGNKKITPFLVMTKYKTFTQPNYQQKRVRFSLKEDIQISKYYKMYGTDWDKIAQHFKGRSAMMLKNRFYSYIRKKNLIEKLLETPEDAEDYPSGEDEASPTELSLQNPNQELDSEVKAEDLETNEDTQADLRITTRSMEREKMVTN